jgi:hypothetical protein
MITNIINNTIDRLGAWNPQLFRELKGRLKTRNVAIAATLSLITQLIICLNYIGLLPPSGVRGSHYGRYCLGGVDPSYSEPNYYNETLCTKDLLGNWIILKELWWLDIFTTLSIISIILLLAVGTYMLIADLSQEESKGTINFIRLSPQSAGSVLVGKLLGVPVWLYIFVLLALPFNLIAGLKAHIPLILILGFYGAVMASCIFFYSAALLFGLANSSLGGFQSWLASGVCLLFISITTSAMMGGYWVANNPFDWLSMFSPVVALHYLVDSTHLNLDKVGYLRGHHLSDILWYGENLWSNALTGIGFLLCNYALWSYCIWRCLKRRFHNPIATILTKQQSYLISFCYVVVCLGFTLQTSDLYNLKTNYAILQVFNVMFILLITALLTPHRQTLQDWARYRHYNGSQGRSLMKDLVWGEKSPSTLAIAVNIAIITIYILPSLFFLPQGNYDNYKISILMGLVASANMILIYGAIVQLMLYLKNSKRAFWAGLTITSIIILPLVCFGMFRIEPSENPLLWLFSFIPMVATEYVTAKIVLGAILGQWLGIVLLNAQMTRQLQQAGESASKQLLAAN